MAEEPSTSLLSNWRDRIVELRTQIDVLDDEVRSFDVEEKQLHDAKLQFDNTVRRERRELLKELDNANAKATELEQASTVQLQRKADLHATYIRTLDEYDQLRAEVKGVLSKEEALAARTDYDQLLQKESYEWAEEEHQLRTAYNRLQVAMKESKAKQQSELTATEQALREAESRLHSDRMSRDPTAGSHRSKSQRQPSVANPTSILQNQSVNLPRKSESRKRDQFGDLTNQSI